MIIEKNGIKLELSEDRYNTNIQILEQSKEATKLLKRLKVITDNETGFSIRSNKYPSYTSRSKRIFVRGSERDQNDKVVQVPKNHISYSKLSGAIDRILDKLDFEEASLNDANAFVEDNKHHELIGGGTTTAANTTLVRMAFINKQMAEILRLTHYERYPEKCIEWEAIEAIFTLNDHYNEHIGQIVDVLNKSIGHNGFLGHVVNEHRVTIEGAKWTVKFLKDCFEKALAQGPDRLIAFWRLVTGLRGPDFTDE